MMQLPQFISPLEFDEFYRLQPDLWLEAVYEVFSEHGIKVGPLETFKDGSNLLAADSSVVAKIFPPFHRHQWESECRVLCRLQDSGIEIPIPRLLAHGERQDGWTYALLSRLPGKTLESVWPQCTYQEKATLMRSIGSLMARVHAVQVGDLHDLNPDWHQFLEEQRMGYLSRHSRLGMPEWFLREAETFVTAQYPKLNNESLVILTGEYTPFNLLVDGGPGEWRISGMIDFGDAMIGSREYDFLGPCLFLAEGVGGLIDSLFDGYGYVNPRSNSDLRHRLMLLAVLHRYSNLKFQIRIDDWEERAKSLVDLENLIFSLEKGGNHE